MATVDNQLEFDPMLCVSSGAETATSMNEKSSECFSPAEQFGVPEPRKRTRRSVTCFETHCSKKLRKDGMVVGMGTAMSRSCSLVVHLTDCVAVAGSEMSEWNVGKIMEENGSLVAQESTSILAQGNELSESKVMEKNDNFMAQRNNGKIALENRQSGSLMAQKNSCELVQKNGLIEGVMTERNDDSLVQKNICKLVQEDKKSDGEVDENRTVMVQEDNGNWTQKSDKVLEGNGIVMVQKSCGKLARDSNGVVGGESSITMVRKSFGELAREYEQTYRHNEPKKYRYFREEVERSRELAYWRLQEGPCASSYYKPCISCARVRRDKNGFLDCRYYNRMLRGREDPKIYRRLSLKDVEGIHESFLMDDADVVDQFIDFALGDEKQKAEAAQMAAYTLQCVFASYEKVVRREQDIIRGFTEATAYFSHAFSAKQICDVCRFVILNAHFCCQICGAELCAVCYKELQEKSPDQPKWLSSLPCLYGRIHDGATFHLASFLPTFDIFRRTLQQAKRQMRRFGIKSGGALCSGNHGRGSSKILFQQGKCYCPRFSPRAKFPVETICVIEDQFAKDAYAQFKAHLTAHNPIIVENVNRHPCYRRALWTQEAFEKILASDRNLRVLDSRDFLPAMIHGKPCSLKMFWSKFRSKREDDECYLKIKDFPESKLFSNIAPDQYINLYEILPFLEYTHINREESNRGRLNLLNLFNDKLDRPDPGPKAYICFGLYNAPHLSSTPLHLDVSDAVNFLPLVKPPDEMSRQEIRETVEKRLDVEGLTGYQRERAVRDPEKAGAIWKIFHPSDNGKIRAAIEEWKRMRGEEWDGDVIHNQDVVVDRKLMDHFKEKGIECRLFVQVEGDVVFIPSGAAHQVQNIFSCVKVAEDFVAPEGIHCTVEVTNELRSLHVKDDLVQVDTLLHLACSSASAVLGDSEPGLVSSSLPQ